MSKKPDFVKAMKSAVDDLGLDGRPDWTDNLLDAVGTKVAAGKGELTKGARDKIKRGMAAEFDDIRLFGAVLTFGTNAGQVRGPMQIAFGRSVDPILPQEAAITQCAITKESDRAANRRSSAVSRGSATQSIANTATSVLLLQGGRWYWC